MSIKQSPIQVQKTILAPSMQQSIEILLLPLAELDQAIEQELQENPLLEVEEKKQTAEHERLEEIINKNIQHMQNAPGSPTYDHLSDDEVVEEKQIMRHPPLEDCLLQQLHLEFTSPEELKVGEQIIGNLDEDGYLTLSCEDIAALSETEDIELVERVLRAIQTFEPMGIASRSLEECLIRQVPYRFNGKSDLIAKVIHEHLEDLGKKNFENISRKLKISIEDVKDVAKSIATLEPKPARKFRPINSNIYVKPDVTISKDENDQYQVYMNKDSIPQLRISKLYQKMLKEPNRTLEEINFIKEKIKNALWFIKSIEQRHTTIKNIAKCIAEHQKDFFEQGAVALKPLILKDVAQQIDRNESTVCRAINNKYMDTPQGLLPMKYFFSQAINNDENSSLSSQSVKEEIKIIVDEEDPSNPLSDTQIQEFLNKRNMKVARRTISKYRQALNILPSHLRKH